MAEPFVFCFRPDAHGHPEQMYINDVWCGCAVCGHAQIQRFYHATSFHTLTLERLQALIVSSHRAASYECENCGSEVGPQEVRTGVLRFAFADDCGEIVSYVNDFGAVDGPSVTYQCVPQRRLDPQVQPRFEPEENVPCHDVLTGDLVYASFARSISLKHAMRALLQEWSHSDDEGDVCVVERLAPGFWVVMGDADEALVEEGLKLAPELERLEDSYTWMLLDESEPEVLATHTNPSRISGSWRGWVPERLQACMEDGELEVWCAVSHEEAERVLTRAFDIARLSYTREEDEEGLAVFTQIRTPRDAPYEQDVSIWSVLQRAVHTGISPGDAARLTAEEVVGVMLRVWMVAAQG